MREENRRMWKRRRREGRKGYIYERKERLVRPNIEIERAKERIIIRKEKENTMKKEKKLNEKLQGRISVEDKKMKGKEY